MATLQAALKHAIQAEFQLEDDELAAEPLPDEQTRRTLLFYESTEGGAGVLRRIVDEPDALARVARAAIALCHVDPDSGAELPPEPGREHCEAACYQCLLSYRNQPDHHLLDRQLVISLLQEWRHAVVHSAQGDRTPDEERDALTLEADSELERAFIAYLDERGLRKPSRAGVLIADAGTRPDFLYDEDNVAVYVDGPPHEYPDRQRRDAEITVRLKDLGWTVIRFGHRDDWAQIVDSFKWVFGEGT
jgi:very-short-patch-repair endonuclease